MKISKAKSSWFKGTDYRLDASFHLSEGRVFKKKIENYDNFSPLNKLTKKIFNGPRFKRYYVRSINKGVPFMGSSDMMKSDINNLKLISKKLSNNLLELKIKKDWILVSCSGTIGNTVFTNEEFDSKMASQHIMRIVPNKNIEPGFLYSFLSSKFGYGLLTQGTYGAVIQHIEPHHIEQLPVPNFSQKNQNLIHSLIIESGQLRFESNKYLKRAVVYLENKIGKSDVDLKHQFGKVSSKSINDLHVRLDAQYQLVWQALKNEIKEGLDYSKIKDYAKTIFVGGRGKRMYVKNGVPFLSSSDMMLYNPKRNCKQVSKRTNGLESMMVSKNDILISRSGTVGNTVLVGDQLDNTAISEHALRLIIDPEKISPNYVFCFLKTKYGMKSMEASSFGSVIITLNEDLIGNIDMPILSKVDQDKISELIENYITKMDKSVALENEAIDFVEKEIEQWQK